MSFFGKRNPREMENSHKYELALRLQIVAVKFELISVSKSTKVDFRHGHVYCEKNLETNICTTIACHGGWAGVVLGNKTKKKYRDFYTYGIRSLNEFLQISNFYTFNDSFQIWAHRYPEYWGNCYGNDMFSINGHLSFNKEFGHVTLLDIANHYRMVASRLLNDINGIQ